MIFQRTPAQKKAQELAVYLRNENPDFNYLRSLFKYLCQELRLQSPSTSQHSREIAIPTSEEIQRYYQWVENNSTVQERVIIKTLLYTGIRLGELVNIQLTDIDFDSHQILIRSERGQDRIVLFPLNFQDLLAMQAEAMSQQQATYLFESPQHQKYCVEQVRFILKIVVQKSGFNPLINPYKIRNFLINWFHKQGVDNAFIQYFFGFSIRQSLTLDSQPSLREIQEIYNRAMTDFPV